MKIEIKQRWNMSLLFDCEADSLGMAVKLAVKSGADLSGADLSGADLSGADLYGADLSGADLSGADLSGADLSGADLYGADLSGADLSRADLSGADLSGADLSGADLSGADLSGADLSGAYLYGTKIIKAPIQIVCGLQWPICITEKSIRIGCQVHLADKWFEMTDKEISKMHSQALAWWKIWKPIIKKMHDEHIKGVDLKECTPQPNKN